MCKDGEFSLYQAKLLSIAQNVPYDIAVVGYNNREFTWIARPNITTVVVPVCKMGKIAADILLQQIANGTRENEEVKVKGELVDGIPAEQVSLKNQNTILSGIHLCDEYFEQRARELTTQTLTRMRIISPLLPETSLRLTILL